MGLAICSSVMITPITMYGAMRSVGCAYNIVVDLPMVNLPKHIVKCAARNRYEEALYSTVRKQKENDNE